MRLIDADALKKEFTEGAFTTRGVREIIDNAPTESEDIVAAFEDGCATECPICRFSIEGGPCKLIQKLLGVDMRGDKE